MTDYRKELAETATKIMAAHKGILAADESPSSLVKKFVTIGLQNTQANRRAYREMLIGCPGLQNHISGVIFQEETAKQKIGDKTFVEYVASKGIVPGIKVDKGTAPLAGGLPEQTFTKGLDSLDAMCKEFYALGCRFAKWRAVIRISPGGPSSLAIIQNAWGLARYAKICQINGLVPIVQPEVLADGKHTIQECQRVSEKVFAKVVECLNQNNVFLEGCLLKPNMITDGLDCPTAKKNNQVQIAHRTLITLSRTIPSALVGIVFLSGGQSEQEASLNLNEINKITTIPKPWGVSFSFGRALQNSALKAWCGKEQNLQKAREAFMVRAKANWQARQGIYKGSSDEKAKQSLYQKDYKY